MVQEIDIRARPLMARDTKNIQYTFETTKVCFQGTIIYFQNTKIGTLLSNALVPGTWFPEPVPQTSNRFRKLRSQNRFCANFGTESNVIH